MADPGSEALLVVDLQYDFLPGGALGVADGDAIVAPIAALVRRNAFGTLVATQDWHAPHHISFASRHPPRRPFDTITLYGRDQVLWPDHCVAGSRGAALIEGVPWEFMHTIVRKGTDPAVDSYSALRNNFDAHGQRPPTGLAGYLRDRGVTAITLCGLARDYCVLWTAEDATALGFATTVLWDLTRPVDPASDAAVRGALAAAGVRVADSAEPG